MDPVINLVSVTYYCANVAHEFPKQKTGSECSSKIPSIETSREETTTKWLFYISNWLFNLIKDPSSSNFTYIHHYLHVSARRNLVSLTNGDFLKYSYFFLLKQIPHINSALRENRISIPIKHFVIFLIFYIDFFCRICVLIIEPLWNLIWRHGSSRYENNKMVVWYIILIRDINACEPCL